MNLTFLLNPLLILLTLSPSVPNSNSEITFDTYVHSFGEILPNSNNKYTFRFTNTGKNVLQIYRIRTGCSCIETNLSGQIFKPGETGSIIINFNPEDSTGKITRWIYVYANTPERSTTLEITATILTNKSKDKNND